MQDCGCWTQSVSDVCGAYLRRKPSGVVGQQGCDRSIVGACLDHPAEVEVSDLDPPVAVHQHVGRLQIPVENGGPVGVQLQDPLQEEEVFKQHA